MYTDGAREIAEGRHDLLQRFVESLEEETGAGLALTAEPPVQSDKNTSSPRI